MSRMIIPTKEPQREHTSKKESKEPEFQSTYLQWVMEGPKQGLIVQTTGLTKEDDLTFYELSDGTRVNVEMVGEVIKPITDKNNPYTFEKIIHKPAPMKEIKGADNEVYYAPDESLSLKERHGWEEIKIIAPRKLAPLPTPQLTQIKAGERITVQ